MIYDKLPRIGSRQEMYQELDKAIGNIRSYEDEEGDFRRTGYLKAQIVESNSPLEKILVPKGDIGFDATAEREIKIMRIHDRNNNVSYSYLDMLNSRFWIIFSLESSDDINPTIKKFVQANRSRLDYSWFSSNSLYKLGSGEEQTSFSIHFSNISKNENIPLKKLSMRLWSDDAKKIIENLLEGKDRYISSGACLTNLEVVHRTGSDFVKTRLSTKGSINIAKGNSVDEFLDYIDKVVNGHYKPLVETIEQDYSLEYAVNDGIQVKGEILSIKLKERITDIERVCKLILKGTQEFRMTGFINKLAEGDYLLNVLDLHNYNFFDLEIFEDEILINLPRKACGNCITRLYALIQEKIDPRAELRGDSGAVV